MAKMHMDAMMQTRKQKVEKFFVFFVTKLGLLQLLWVVMTVVLDLEV